MVSGRTSLRTLNMTPRRIETTESPVRIRVARALTGRYRAVLRRIRTAPIFFALTLLALLPLAQGQTPGFLWARQIGGTGSAKAASVAADSQGNVLLIGSFAGEADFGGITLNTSNQHSDLFVGKYSPSGALIWVKSGGGPDR